MNYFHSERFTVQFSVTIEQKRKGIMTLQY